MTNAQLKLFEDPPGTLHPKWGYDLNKVPGILCSRCKQPIGNEEYVEDTMFARFGDMMFYHRRCVDKAYTGTRKWNQFILKGYL